MPATSCAWALLCSAGLHHRHERHPTTSTWADNYSLLQTGVIESCEAPLSLLLSSSLNEVCKYLCLSGHFVNPFSCA